MRIVAGLFLAIFILGCAPKPAQFQTTFEILIKTKQLKYNDKCFISKFDDNLKLQIYNAGIVLVELEIYDDKICKNYMCMSSKEFNEQNFGENYKDDFLKNILEDALKSDVNFEDKENKIKIEITKDEI